MDWPQPNIGITTIGTGHISMHGTGAHAAGGVMMSPAPTPPTFPSRSPSFDVIDTDGASSTIGTGTITSTYIIRIIRYLITLHGLTNASYKYESSNGW
jgi:hypothetical protein